MITIVDVIRYSYAQASTQIHDLKAAAFRSTVHEKYAYCSPDGKTFRDDRPSDEGMEAGWTYGKVKYERAESHMSQKHPRWRHYQDARARARLLMAALLLLKANDFAVPEKEEVSRDARVTCEAFKEPDMNDEETALAVHPAADPRLFRHLRLL